MSCYIRQKQRMHPSCLILQIIHLSNCLKGNVVCREREFVKRSSTWQIAGGGMTYRQFAGVALLFESVVGLLLRDCLPKGFKPAGPNIRLIIELRHVRLDVKERCAIQDIHIPDVKHTALNLVKLHNRKSDGVRTFGSASGKKPTSLRVQERHDTECESLTAMEVIQQDNVRESVQIHQPGTEFLKHLNRAFHADRTSGLNRHVL